MSRMNRNFAVAAVMVIAAATSMAAAQTVPSAALLLRFYPTRLASTPIGAAEDQDVWLAKVQGLMAGAPPLLQQSLLASQTPQEFAANVALLQQMQEAAARQSVARMQSQLQSGATKQVPGVSPGTVKPQQQ